MMANPPINLTLRTTIFRKYSWKINTVSTRQVKLTWQDGSSDGSSAGAIQVGPLAQPGNGQA